MTSPAQPWFVLHRISNDDQPFYREILACLDPAQNQDLSPPSTNPQRPMSTQSSGICCGKCKLPSGSATTSKMLSRVYRHRETCGTVQAVLFGRKVGKDEDGFVGKFGSAFGFTVRWVHTDRKSQYLFKKQETYKWASVNKSMVTQRFEKPVAEKEIFHLKLVSDFARQRGKKDCHPLKIVCDRWEKSGFIECVAAASWLW